MIPHTAHSTVSAARPAARRGRLRGRCRRGVGALAGLALLAAGPTWAGPEEDLLSASGRQIFVRYCASCHGMDARGDGPAAAALRAVPPDLTTIASRRDGTFPAAEIARFIDGRLPVASHGSRQMPVWGLRFGETISDDETAEEVVRGNISVLIDYLRGIQR